MFALRNRPLRTNAGRAFILLIRTDLLGKSENFRKFMRFWWQLSFNNQKLSIMVKEEQSLYVPPKVKTMEIKAQAIICQSQTDNSEGGIDNYERETFEL